MRRMFWPKEVWGRYARKLDEFKAPENVAPALGCLNELVTDALRHAPQSLAYMAKLRDRDVFRFCAIPQVMAIGTLAMCYNNHGVFTGARPLRNTLQWGLYPICTNYRVNLYPKTLTLKTMYPTGWLSLPALLQVLWDVGRIAGLLPEEVVLPLVCFDSAVIAQAW